MSGGFQRRRGMEAPLHSQISWRFCSGLGKKGFVLFIVSGFFCSEGDSRWAYEMAPLFYIMSRDVLRQFQRAVTFCYFSPGFHRMDIPPFRVFFVISMRGINRLVVAIRRISGFLLSSS
jgi:hypothetical protein